MDEEQIQAISRLYERHAPAVHRYALRRSDPDTAEEVTAQVFLVAWRRRDALPHEPLPWLYGVARRALADQRRGAPGGCVCATACRARRPAGTPA